MMVSLRLVTVLLLVTAFYLVQKVDARRRTRNKWMDDIEEAMLRPWERMLELMGGGLPYKFWNSKKHSKKKYGHSQSASSSSSKSTESGSKSSSSSSSTERRPSDHKSKSYSSGSRESRRDDLKESRELASKLSLSLQEQAAMMSQNDDNAMSTTAAQTFIFYVENYGCQNLTSFQSFMASYNLDQDKRSAQNQVLQEIAKLAQVDLDRDRSAGEVIKSKTTA